MLIDVLNDASGYKMVMDIDALRENIKNARIENGLFEDDIATQYHISVQQYAAFENGRFDLPKPLIWTIALDLGVDLSGVVRPSFEVDSEHAELP